MAKADKQEAVRAKSPTRPVGQRIHQLIADRFGDAVELVDAVDPYTVIKDVERFTEIMTFLKEDEQCRFDFLRSVAGVDWPDDGYIESVYHLYSYPLGHAHVVKYRCPRAAPEVPSVEALWPVANWFERETYDLLGIIYLHHTDLRRIMLPDDWIGHPLRKDYVEEETYRGIGTTRASPLEAFRQMDEERRKAREERGEAPPPVQHSSIEPPEGWVDPKEKKKQEAARKAAEAKKAAENEAPAEKAAPAEAAPAPEAVKAEKEAPRSSTAPDGTAVEPSSEAPPPEAGKDRVDVGAEAGLAEEKKAPAPAAFPSDPKPPPEGAEAETAPEDGDEGDQS